LVFPCIGLVLFLTPVAPFSRFNEYRWFRQSKFPSFQRQLNLYGFKRLTSGKLVLCLEFSEAWNF
jgi:hypothetical protein